MKFLISFTSWLFKLSSNSKFSLELVSAISAYNKSKIFDLVPLDMVFYYDIS